MRTAMNKLNGAHSAPYIAPPFKKCMMNDTELLSEDHPHTNQQTPDVGLSNLIIHLLKGVLYRENEEASWNALLKLQASVRDYAAVLNLDLILDESESYAYFKSKPDPKLNAGEESQTPKLARLVTRRALSFPVSLLIALLRKKLAEFDASGGDTRLVLNKDEIVELIRVFLPDSSNEAKLVDQIETHINKVIELGFLRKLKNVGHASSYEVRRIIKAFVDAQWLADFDARLAQYQTQLQTQLAGDSSHQESEQDE